MTEEYKISDFKSAANQIRKDIINMTYSLGNVGAHLGGSLSMVELLTVLYTGKVNYDPRNPEWEERDRVILSKGHAALALYPALVQAGIIEMVQLSDFKKNGSLLSGHPSLNGLKGIEFASGSLGQGLSLGVGVALALKRKQNTKSKVFVFMGDGECDEGAVWEAAASAAHYGLSQIVAIVDANTIQYDGFTDEILKMNPARQKWIDFGWDAIEIDGHDIGQICDAYDYESDKPKVIIANTVKGKGISFMEGNKQFHNARISEEQYQIAMEELEAAI